MNKGLFSGFLLLFKVIYVSAQFYSHADVLAYLDGKTFVKESVGATLAFSEAGSQLTVNGNYIFFQPDIRIISAYSAFITYYGVNEASSKAGLQVNKTRNIIEDRSNGSIYVLNVESSKSSKYYSGNNVRPKRSNKSAVTKLHFYHEDLKATNEIPSVYIGSFESPNDKLKIIISKADVINKKGKLTVISKRETLVYLFDDNYEGTVLFSDNKKHQNSQEGYYHVDGILDNNGRVNSILLEGAPKNVILRRIQ